ncbi:MAG: pyrophosphohydrolase domain-containing protein [Minisyncoccota bacterium]
MNRVREDSVREFHKVFGLTIDADPTVKLLRLRRSLIDEETKELFSDIDAAIAYLEKGEIVPRELYANMLKELADVQVVVSGTAVTLKPLKELEEAFKRVHDSNMSKLSDDGKPLYREDGKVLKGPNYFEPDLSDLVS